MGLVLTTDGHDRVMVAAVMNQHEFLAVHCNNAEDLLAGKPTKVAIECNCKVFYLAEKGDDVLATEKNENRKKKQETDEERWGDVKLERRPGVISLPEEMQYDEAITWLGRMRDEDEKKVAIHEKVNAYPLDGAWAFQRAMKEKYGWTSAVPTPGFFGDSPPVLVGMEVDAAGTTHQVVWGNLEVPGVDGRLSSLFEMRDGLPQYVLGGVVKQKHLREIRELAARTRQIIAESSIYKGAAIRLSFPDTDNDEVFDPTENAPKFIKVDKIKPEELVFSTETAALVAAAMFTPVEHTASCREAGIPLKRGVLLEGPFGTGKTLSAYVLAKKCVENGWTFIYLDRTADLAAAIRFAKQYAPAVVFAEDIDQLLSEADDRDEAANDVLNTIDGVATKSDEVMVVLTTNNVDGITQAMLRPGRLDTVISVRAPDGPSVERLIRLYGRGLIDAEEDLSAVAATLCGNIPASIREVVERSKLAAISRSKGVGRLRLTAADLLVTGKGMMDHLKLLQPKVVDTRPERIQAADTLGKALTHALSNFGRGSNGKFKTENTEV